MTALAPDLRWPNDLLIGNRKTGGILVEAQTESRLGGHFATAVVIGIGINLHQQRFPPNLATEPTSLDLETGGAETGRYTSRQDLLIAILQQLHAEISAIPGNFASIPARIAAISTWVQGRKVEVHGPQPCTGITEGLDQRGFLRVRTESGVVTITTGGIRAARRLRSIKIQKPSRSRLEDCYPAIRMLLALDVGNTNTVLGLYNSADQLVAHWRVSTHRTQTADEYGVFFVNLFNLHGLSTSQVQHIIISSVVPPVESTLSQVCESYFHLKPLFVEPGIKTGMPVLVDNPAELGADRLVNAIAAYEKYGGPAIIVDFGTATTFDVVSVKGEYLGGIISPGLGISADALFSRAARLGRVDIKRPAKVIGTTTVAHIQSGLYYGYIGLVDGILERMIAEMGTEPHEPAQRPKSSPPAASPR